MGPRVRVYVESYSDDIIPSLKMFNHQEPSFPYTDWGNIFDKIGFYIKHCSTKSEKTTNCYIISII